MRASDIIGRLPGYKGKFVLVKKYQGSDDIISLLLKQHKDHAKDFDRVAADFWAGSPEATAEKLFDFIKNNVKYVIEPDHKQTVMSPGAMLARRQGDCKHYASFIVGVLDSLKRQGYQGFEPVYRFSSYKLMDKTPQHVFAVMKLQNGEEVWIDPVLRSFDQKKRYYYSTDRKPMALYYLSGVPGYDAYNRKSMRFPATATGKSTRFRIGDVDFDAIGAPKPKKIARQQKRVAKLQKKNPTKAAKVQAKQEFRNQGAEARKAERKSGQGPKGLKKILLKGNPALLAGRNSFQLLLKANVFRMATKIYTKAKEKPAFKEKINTWWRNLGGNPAALWMNVQRGVNTYNKLHKKKKISGMGNFEIAQEAFSGVWEHPEWGSVSIGAAPAAVGIAAAIAAAMPIIMKLVALFKKEGIPTDGMEEGVDSAIETTADIANEQANGDMTRTEAAQASMDEFGIPYRQAPVNMTQANDGSTDMTFPAETEIASGNTDQATGVRLDDPATRGADGITNAFNTAKNWFMAPGAPWYKKPVVLIPGGLALLYVVPKIVSATRGPKRRRR